MNKVQTIIIKFESFSGITHDEFTIFRKLIQRIGGRQVHSDNFCLRELVRNFDNPTTGTRSDIQYSRRVWIDWSNNITTKNTSEQIMQFIQPNYFFSIVRKRISTATDTMISSINEIP